MKKVSSPSLGVLPTLSSGITAADAQLLKENGRLERYSKGQEIQKEGEAPTRQLIILSGYCAIQIMGRVLTLLAPGATVGTTVLEVTHHSATLTAISPVTLISFDSQLIGQVWLRNPTVMLRVLDSSIKRLHWYQTYLYQLSNPALDIRLAAVMWAMGEPQPDGSRKLPAPVTQTILASMLRVGREEVGRKRKLLIAARYLVQKDGAWYLDAMTPVLFLAED